MDGSNIHVEKNNMLHRQVLGRDRELDVAVLSLKLPTSQRINLPTAQLGSANNLLLGQWLIALGHAGGHVRNYVLWLRCMPRMFILRLC
jgi:S1-C subfamily serine protease